MTIFKSDANVKIAVEDINPGGKYTVLLLHGWPLNHKMYEYQLDILPQYGFRCVAVDFRGFGESDCPAQGYSYDQMAKDVYNAVRALNLRPFVLAGFSMGGAVALRYMSLFGGYRVSKLALLAAAAPSFTMRPDFPYGMTKQAVDELIEGIYTDRPKAITEFGKSFFGAEHSEELEGWFTRLSLEASGIGTINAAVSLRDEDMRFDLGKVDVPTGIFHGKADKVCPYELALELQKGIANSTLFTFEKSGHGLFLDELKEFNERFINFLLG